MPNRVAKTEFNLTNVFGNVNDERLKKSFFDTKQTKTFAFLHSY